MKEKKIFNIDIEEGDAMIHLKNDKTVTLIFAEDGDTKVREMAWPDHEVYKTAVQFALMIDSYFKNSEGLDNLILNSPTGNIAAELLGKDLLQISLAGVGDLGEVEVNNVADEFRFAAGGAFHADGDITSFSSTVASVSPFGISGSKKLV